jgi:glutathione S-transferase
MTSEEKYTLYYFNVNARGCVARAILSHVKANWENKVIEYNDFVQNYKHKKEFCEYGQLPILEYKGKFYSQSMAIDLFLGKKYNLLGDNEEQEYEINNLLCSFEDIFPLIHDQKTDHKLKYEKMRRYLKLYEEKHLRHVKENNGGKFYFGNNKFTLADTYFGALIFSMLNSLKEIDMEKEFPYLKKLLDSYKAEEALKEFYEKYYINTIM